MSNVLGNLFGEIAEAIRAKTGGTDTMKPAEFPAEIAAIPTGGGGGNAGEWVMATGDFVPTSEVVTISHGLGVVPDIAFIAVQIGGAITGATRQVLVSSFGVSQRLGNSAALVSGKSIILGSSVVLNYTSSPPATVAGTTNSAFIDLPESDAWFPIHSANANTIGFGDALMMPLLTSGIKYNWCVMAMK